jgi:uncharacterized membrane protein YczE
MKLAVVQPVALTFALALAVIGFSVEALTGHVVVGTLSAVIVAGAGVDYWRFHVRPDAPPNADVVHRLVFYVATLALMHGAGLDVIDAWIRGG